MKVRKKKWNYPILFFILFFIFILVLYFQFTYLSLSKKVYGIDIHNFALNRNTVTNILKAKGGTIFDLDGNVLATDVSSYTLVAYLDPKRKTDYVDDKEYTAHKLSTVLGEENEEYILNRLNSNSKQVEFGNIGKNLTELTKLAIEDLGLSGIGFNESIRRYYPNGDFASYIIGYAKQYTKINIKINEEYDLYKYYKNYFDNYEGVVVNVTDSSIVRVIGSKIIGLKQGKSMLTIKSDELVLAHILINVNNYEIYNVLDNSVIGELGIESKFNQELEGIDGYTKYEQDKYGYKIPETKEETVESIDGFDIYLTIDSNIQRFAESSINEIKETDDPDYSLIAVMDAKDGSILASATSPSFNPNNLTSDMSYQNPLVSYTYEPGSVMKIYTYMCALETGNYDGNKTFLSGNYEFEDGTVIRDWNRTGWGEISYDTGFTNSSNTGIINIIKDYLSREALRECLQKYGFGKKTDIELSQEAKGNIDFKYETELMSAGFGQGISTTAVQQLQALTLVANNGELVKPHIISKKINSKTKEVIETKVEKSKKLVSESTISKIRELMKSVISDNSTTGKNYYMPDFDLIGKTGTAQISEHGAYLTGDNDYIISVALMYPKDDPEIIIYALAKRPKNNINSVLVNPVKELIRNIAKYRLMMNSNNNPIEKKVKLDNYYGKNVVETKSKLDANNLNVIIIGDGDVIINQYPAKGNDLVASDKVFLLTNGLNRTMNDLTNWSKNDVNKYCELLNINCNFNGYGYVTNQNIEVLSLITPDTVLEIELQNRNKIKSQN